MNERRHVIQLAIIANVLLWVSNFAHGQHDPALGSKPNIIYMSCDNLGYGDVEPFGSKLHRTPNLTRMATEGMKFTHYYSASGVCTSSRAALLTGCYPCRVSMDVTDGAVLRPVSQIGLHPEETTIAEVLKLAGYSTAIFGKWHLGDQVEFLPTRQGFDYYLGIPYSDDMTPLPNKNWPPLPLMENEKVIAAPADRHGLTKRLTQAAVQWIRQHQRESFFLYFPQCMPGSTEAPFASSGFQGRSGNGPWGDSVEELDWSIGEILKVLKELSIDDRTLVIWTSDNGAPQRMPLQGSNGSLAGWGYTTAEGGMRVPCIMRWPGKIPAGTECAEMATMMDMLPTFAFLAGVEQLPPRDIDGKNIWPLMEGRPGAASPHRAFYYYHLDQLQAIRSGRWKLYVGFEVADSNGNNEQQALRLYDVITDPGETTDLTKVAPREVRRLLKFAEKARSTLGDRGRPSRQRRPAGHVVNPVPQRLQ
jgi:arylsulfatase A-like enzyme